MQVILLERIGRLGQMGDVVNVKDGYARNFLLPQRKALRATKENMEEFQARRVQLEAHNLELKKEAEAVAAKLEGKHWMFQNSAARLNVIRMCEDCRVVAITEQEFDPYGAPPRPRPRTTEDYLREREEQELFRGASQPGPAAGARHDGVGEQDEPGPRDRRVPRPERLDLGERRHLGADHDREPGECSCAHVILVP